MINLKVEGIHCQMCIKRIESAFNNANIKFEIIFSEKLILVEENMIEQAIKELEDLGFEAVKV